MKNKTFIELCEIALSVPTKSLDLKDYFIRDHHFVVRKQMDNVQALIDQGSDLRKHRTSIKAKEILINICENL